MSVILGPSHIAVLPSLRAPAARPSPAPAFRPPEIAVQAARNKDSGETLIDFIGPTGERYELSVDDAIGVVQAIQLAINDTTHPW